MDKPSSISVGQLNLQGSATATQELPIICRTLELDLVLVQEQYCQTRTLQHGPTSKAGIMVNNQRLAVTFLDHLSNDHCAVAHVCHQGLSIYFISMYCQYSHDIAVHLQHLTYVLDKLTGQKVLVGMDSNAHSPLWHCETRQYVGRGPDTEYRKTQMESFILGRGLMIQNVEGQPPTFSGANGYSNVDLTLTNRGVKVSQWQVHEGASVSDHQLITFVVNVSGAPDSVHYGEQHMRFRDHGVNWERFRGVLHHRMGQLSTRGPAASICEDYSRILTRTAQDCLGTRQESGNRGYEWWTPELDKMRRSVGKARRDWQQSRKKKSSREPELHDSLRRARVQYKEAMRNAEIAYSRGIAETGNDDPWGLAYRASSGRIRPPSNVMHGIRLLEEGITTTAKETMTGLLSTLCPDDDPRDDTPYHRAVRIAAACSPSGKNSELPSQKNLENIIKDLPNTAPGLDGITAKIIKHAWRASGAEMLLMYSACLDEGIFPDVWKAGKLLVLPKGNDRPLSDPKAYRPITLLPILGKILERLIISCAPSLQGNISLTQHGFARGKSTVTALHAVLDRVASTEQNYVQLILLDISGAFDNAWWPMILTKAKQGGIPPNIYKILVSYFNGRRVGLFVGDQVVWKRSTMGCPQGSVLGPTLWNVLLDDILRLPMPEGVSMVAYADDVTIVIEAPSRAAIEHKARVTLTAVSEWGKRNRLSFSAEKSQTMTMKGKFKRPPTIRLDGASVTHVNHARLLGVCIDEASSYVQHANFAGLRAVKCFGKVSRISASTWGVRYRALRILYIGTYVATLTYAAAVWWRRSSHYAVRSALLRTQRPALVLLTKAYRSVSTAALPVLAATLPADLEVVRAGRVAQECPGLDTSEERKSRKILITREIFAQWQDRWSSSADGRELHAFFPRITDRMSYVWVEPDYVVSQILTGHGCFRFRLHKMRLCESAECFCGHEAETRDHVLWECSLYAEERYEMLTDWFRVESGPVYHGDLVASAEGFRRLRAFAHKWHRKRKEYEL